MWEKTLGIDEIKYELLPHEKLTNFELIKKIQNGNGICWRWNK